IFNRYGQMIFEGNDGWDGTYRGVLVDPGVYYYNCDIQSNVFKGSIEVVKIE
ncbi:MAG: gliding motility-associated C-terminal domain-containing protein, partial [Paludibacteraceae bacterium]|nr:gliding motility-associated C-terminal domain-containing protein [Paludibacteraceae bacterium]